MAPRAHDSGWQRTLALTLLGVLLVILLIGVTIPGAMRDSVERAVAAPFPLSSLAHLLLFASMAAVATARPLGWARGRVLLLALCLALLTEGLQFFAVERQPGWADVGFDMAGALLGVVVVCCARLAPASS